MVFKFTKEEISKMEAMINNFENDDRRPFLSGTVMEVREIRLDNSRNYELDYVIRFGIESIDEEDEEGDD